MRATIPTNKGVGNSGTTIVTKILHALGWQAVDGIIQPRLTDSTTTLMAQLPCNCPPTFGPDLPPQARNQILQEFKKKITGVWFENRLNKDEGAEVRSRRPAQRC